MAALAIFVSIPVSVKKMIEDQRPNFRFLVFFELFGIAFEFIVLSVALGINLGGEQNVLAIRGPEFCRQRFRVAIEVSLCTDVTVPADPSKSAIQTCEPPSLFEMNANRLPSGAQRGRSAS